MMNDVITRELNLVLHGSSIIIDRSSIDHTTSMTQVKKSETTRSDGCLNPKQRQRSGQYFINETSQPKERKS
jgi:hypothetical protein